MYQLPKFGLPFMTLWDLAAGETHGAIQNRRVVATLLSFYFRSESSDRNTKETWVADTLVPSLYAD